MKHITIKEVTDLNIQEMLNNPANIHGAAGRQITDTLNNFSIEDSLGVYIKIGDYDSYTFKIHRPNAPRVPLENLVISKTETGYEALLYIYDVTEEELHKIEAQERVNLDGKFTKKLLNTDIAVTITSGKYYFNAECFQDNWQYVAGSLCEIGGHAFGEPCRLIGGPQQATAGGWVNMSTLVPCVSGGTPNVPGGVPSTSGGSSGGVKGGTTPVSQSPQYMRKKKFSMENADLFCDTTIENEEALTQIFNYLETGNIQGTIFLGLGPNVTTYPPDRLNVVAEALEKMCQDPETFTSIVPFLIEDQIDDSQLDECSKGVLDEIKGLQNMDVAKILARFGADASIYNTIMVSNVASGGGIGQADYIASYNYKITISTDYTGKTKLMIAYTLMHELVHAYFFSMIDDCYLQNNCDLLSTFPELWEYCMNHNDSNYPSDPIAHHEEIASTYLSVITAALQEYQPGLPLQVYEDIAWGGLMETSSFDVLHPANSVSRQRIMNRTAAEQTGNPIAGGTPPNYR